MRKLKHGTNSMDNLIKWEKFFESNNRDYLLAFKEMVEDMGYSYFEQLEYIPLDPGNGDTVSDTSEPVTHKCMFVSVGLNSEYQDILKLNNVLRLVTDLLSQKKRLESFGVEDIKYQFLESYLNLHFIYKFTNDEIFNHTIMDIEEDTDDIGVFCSGVSREDIKVNKSDYSVVITLNANSKEDYNNYVSNYLCYFESDKKIDNLVGSTRKGTNNPVYTYIVKLIRPRSENLPKYN